MKALFFLLFMTCSSAFLFGQTVLNIPEPMATYGVYITNDVIGEPDFANGYWHDKDTIINGFTYSSFLPYNPHGRWIKQDGNKIYSVLSWDLADEELIYDFDLVVGDTFRLDYFNELIVTAVFDTMFLDGILRKTIELQNIVIPSWTIWWVEGIGDLHGGLYYSYGGLGSFYMVCYGNHSGLVYLDNDFTQMDCDNAVDIPVPSSNTNPQETTSPSVLIYPNPVNTGQIMLDVKNDQGAIEASIYNSSGQFIETLNVTKDEYIDVQHLSSGLYILLLQMEGQNVSKRIIID